MLKFVEKLKIIFFGFRNFDEAIRYCNKDTISLEEFNSVFESLHGNHVSESDSNKFNNTLRLCRVVKIKDFEIIQNRSYYFSFFINDNDLQLYLDNNKDAPLDIGILHMFVFCGTDNISSEIINKFLNRNFEAVDNYFVAVFMHLFKNFHCTQEHIIKLIDKFDKSNYTLTIKNFGSIINVIEANNLNDELFEKLLNKLPNNLNGDAIAEICKLNMDKITKKRFDRLLKKAPNIKLTDRNFCDILQPVEINAFGMSQKSFTITLDMCNKLIDLKENKIFSSYALGRLLFFLEDNANLSGINLDLENAIQNCTFYFRYSHFCILLRRFKMNNVTLSATFLKIMLDKLHEDDFLSSNDILNTLNRLQNGALTSDLLRSLIDKLPLHEYLDCKLISTIRIKLGENHLDYKNTCLLVDKMNFEKQLDPKCELCYDFKDLFSVCRPSDSKKISDKIYANALEASGYNSLKFSGNLLIFSSSIGLVTFFLTGLLALIPVAAVIVSGIIAIAFMSTGVALQYCAKQDKTSLDYNLKPKLESVLEQVTNQNLEQKQESLLKNSPNINKQTPEQTLCKDVQI